MRGSIVKTAETNASQDDSATNLDDRSKSNLFLWNCCCCAWRRNRTKVLSWCDILANSFFWRMVIIVFTVLLLFGSPMQFLILPKEADKVFDILYLIALAVFLLDMVLSIAVVPNYLGCGRLSSSAQQQQTSQNQFATIYGFGVGSFTFWCDLLSTTALMHDISYINQREYETQELNLVLNQYGVPINFDQVNSKYPFDLNIEFVVLVAKTARVAKLIPSSTVVEISSRINFYWYIERISPSWYYRKYKERQEAARRMREEMEPNRGISRRGTWAGLEVNALATVKALADRRKKKQEESGRFSRILKKAKRSFGVGPTTNMELKRHIAATKIQRAWRNRLAQDGVATFDEEGTLRARSAAALERVLKKRSKSGLKSQNANLDQNTAGTGKRSYLRSGFRDARADSQVGSAMAEVTGQWVATVTLLSLFLTIFFTYNEADATRPSTMVVLHGQVVGTANLTMAAIAIASARQSSIPGLFKYDEFSNSTNIINFTFPVDDDISELRVSEILRITVHDEYGTTVGLFGNRQAMVDQSIVELAATFFVLLVWFLGVTAFAGPVMTLVIIPIERMVRLLGMLMVDPLGYQSNLRFKKFMVEEDALIKKSQWTKEVLKGMETSFLMSTILRIGSLMKVGFGSAGVEIIRNNLQKGHKNMLILNSQGSTVSCIFLFCDIRSFTDATECLQEEVFVFTNRIAAVVHSICHSYGGSANKNVGDAFLVSWLLEDDAAGSGARFSRSKQALVARHHQADKALLSVVKICMALYYDDYYVDTMSDNARTALLNKLKNRPGPIVQMGFGLHAGKAVQGAIGSQRKIDATYVSEAVEKAEYLESSTKDYGLRMLMSDDFHRLLHASNRRRCRKIDLIMFHNKDEEVDEEEEDAEGDVMELYTYDMDIDALWKKKKTAKTATEVLETETEDSVRSTRINSTQGSRKKSRRLSLRPYGNEPKRSSGGSEDMRGSLSSSAEISTPSMMAAAKMVASELAGSTFFDVELNEDDSGPGELVLPTGPALYSANIWLQEDMRRIRQPYTSVVFQTFNSGLQRYYDKDWVGARQCFESILEIFEDGPSKYFLRQMKKHNWKPPPNFQSYGKA